MKRILLSLCGTLFVTPCWASGVQADDVPTLCKSYQVNVMSCEIVGPKKRIVSVCADSSDYGKSFDGVSYLFGNEREIELEYSADGGDLSRKFYRGTDSTTYTTYIAFKQSGYVYVVGVPEERQGATAFVSVYRGSAKLKDMSCKTNSFGMKNIQSKQFVEVDGKDLALGKVK